MASDGFDAPRNVATPNTNPAWAELGSDDNEDELVTDGGEPQDRASKRDSGESWPPYSRFSHERNSLASFPNPHRCQKVLVHKCVRRDDTRILGPVERCPDCREAGVVDGE